MDQKVLERENKSDYKYYLSSANGSYSSAWSVSKCCQGSSSILIMLKTTFDWKSSESSKGLLWWQIKIAQEKFAQQTNYSHHFYSQNRRLNVLFLITKSFSTPNIETYYWAMRENKHLTDGSQILKIERQFEWRRESKM